jgi:diguanylate cyclase (GGDEF)-like protein/PAS domain S-box-containing protein
VVVRCGDGIAARISILGRKWGLVLLVLAIAALLPLAPSLPLLDLPPPMRVSLHVGIKMVGAAIALAISLLTWNTRRGQPINFVFAGFGFFATAVLGAVDLLLLPGTPGLALGHDSHISTVVLRLGANCAAGAALLAAALGPSRQASARAIRIGIALTVGAVALSVCVAIAAPRWSNGTRQALAGVELALSLVVLVTAGLLLRRFRRGQATFGLLTLASMLAGIGMVLGSGLPTGDMSQAVLDDAYKTLAWLLVYRALFREGVLAPWHRLVDSGRAVEEDRQRYHQLFESAPDGLLLVGAAGTIIEANPSAAAMFGWSTSGIIGQPVEALIPQHLRVNHELARAGFLAAPRTREMGGATSLWAVRRDGDAFPVEVALVPQEFTGRRTTLCIVRDVTERRQLEESLRRQALHDALTDLPNRRHFRESVTKALAHGERHGGTLAVLFIDLDNFKQVNDTLGHSHGDELLRQVAHRLTQTLRAGDLLARMGGDEFALLLIGAKVEDAAAVAGKVLRVVERPFHHAGQTMKVGASIGITMFPADGSKVEDLLSNADLAMYRAKGHGRNTWRFFERRMTERVRARSSLQQDLVRAIERGQFMLEFQPRVRASDGALTGFESLLRWRHPERGNVAPDVFIALAEESGQIVPIGEWVLRESCAQATRWRSVGGGRLTMAVNVSTHQLRHPGFAATVQQMLIETGWPAEQLELEITETALMQDPREAAALLRQLAALGVRLAVDDFGTGYSSLAYLKDYPLHRLKVDRSFVQGLHVNSSDRVIASSIIQLAHALGLQVTAEGIETSQQREFLVQQQCDELQGYLFSAPIPAAACEAWLQPLTRSHPVTCVNAAD